MRSALRAAEKAKANVFIYLVKFTKKKHLKRSKKIQMQ